MIKKITTTIKENKKAIQKRIIVIAGTALGAFVAGVLVARTEAPFDEVIVVEEDVTVEELPGEEIPTEN